MAKRVKTKSSESKSPVADVGPSGGGGAAEYRHPAKRKNNPPANIAAEGVVPVIPKVEYAYNPHLPPVLRFDAAGDADVLETRLSVQAEARVGELLKAASSRALTAAEVAELGGLVDRAAKARVAAEPWLEWTGKRERKSFEVDPVALHIHDRVSTQAILRVAARQDAAKSLFADPEQEYHEAVQFYRHDIDWTNRLILGDSLQVMSSLARREDLAGKVQFVYMDPPYGIKFASNFQPEVGRRDVKDKEQDLTREPEMVRAYRDTWHLGVHSYLSYLRDRLMVARELLADTGSIFVQISDENVHRVRQLLDEVFGEDHFVSSIAFVKTTSSTSNDLSSVYDVLLWYRKSERMKYRPIFGLKQAGEVGATGYRDVLLESGELRPLSEFLDDEGNLSLPTKSDLIFADNYTSQSPGSRYDVNLCGRVFRPEPGYWKTEEPAMKRLVRAERVAPNKSTLGYLRRISDFPAFPLSNIWTDTLGQAQFGGKKLYAVQTALKVVTRCMLMTTDPGDLVLDPTCGSGTTAYVAEQWGRRWITTDTSRVAVAIARQRLMTAKFPYYKLRALTADDRKRNPSGTWLADPSDPKREPRTLACRTVPHVMPSDISQNTALDAIFARHEPVLEKALAACNAALAKVPAALATKLSGKLAVKEREQGKKSVTDADRRRWLLPPGNREKPRTAEERKRYTVDLDFAGWYAWEVPFDTDADWPAPLVEAVNAYRKAWRAKMDEVNAAIAASAEQEELVDDPEVAGKVVRVSGPFTVEAVQPPELSLGEAGEPLATDALAPDGLETFHAAAPVEPKNEVEVLNVGAYLDQMYRYLRADGVRFLNNKQMKWGRLEPLWESGKAGVFHAEGRWVPVGEEDKDPDADANVAVVFGPQYGPVTGPLVVETLRQAHRAGYDHVVIAGFNFDGAAQTEVDRQGNPRVKLHLSHIRPDINPGMNGLLKDPPKPGTGQLFTVFGLPRIAVSGPDRERQYTVTMEGVDIYNPVDDTIKSSDASKVAAWFLDGDYDGRTFCITQAFFPDKTAWSKLAAALGEKSGAVDPARFEALSGTTSLPFPAGRHKCVAVKVIDPRGNEVMAVERLGG